MGEGGAGGGGGGGGGGLGGGRTCWGHSGSSHGYLDRALPEEVGERGVCNDAPCEHGCVPVIKAHPPRGGPRTGLGGGKNCYGTTGTSQFIRVAVHSCRVYEASFSSSPVSQVLGVLGGPDDQRAVENELVLSLGFEHFELIKELIKNRWAEADRGVMGVC